MRGYWTYRCFIVGQSTLLDLLPVLISASQEEDLSPVSPVKSSHDIGSYGSVRMSQVGLPVDIIDWGSDKILWPRICCIHSYSPFLGMYKMNTFSKTQSRSE